MGENELQQQGENIDQTYVVTDDRTEPVFETRERAPERAPVKEEPKLPKEGSPYDETRNSIVAKLRAQRDRTDKEPTFDVDPEQERRQVGPHVATREDRNRPPASEAVQEQLTPENVPPPRRMTLKVNGEDREFDEDQVINYARIAVASQDALNDAKRERDAARDERQRASEELAEIRRLRALHSPSEGNQPTPTPAKAEDSKPATDEELDDIIEAIQTGDIADAKKALQTYGDQIERRMSDKIGNIDQRIAASIRQQQEDTRVHTETQNVIESFLAENADFASHDMRGRALIDESVQVMRENLAAIGVKDETITNIARQYNVAPQFAVGMATRMLRGKGYDLPDNATVMRTAATRVREGFGLPAPAARVQPAPAPTPAPINVAERLERKQAMPSQPRRANISPGAEAAPAKTQDQRRADAVANMRAFRRGR